MSATTRLRVVGIGASAGGLEACSQFLSLLPVSAELTCVLAQHLPTDGETECWARQLRLRAGAWKVKVGAPEQKLEAGEVLVIPAGYQGGVGADCRLKLQPAPSGQLSQPSVDALFCSLAIGFGKRALAVVLSGTGSDGLAGCRAIASAGGAAFAQTQARFSGMPEAVRDARLARSGSLGWIAEQLCPLPVKEARLEEVLALVQRRSGWDFHSYKPETLWRRIQARMARLGHLTLASYLDVLRAQPAELELLQSHFLVSLSSFFRDPECFEALSAHVGDTLSGQEKWRAWVPACATGEEVYSLAILVQEVAGNLPLPRVEFLGTDLNAKALQVAQRAIYPLSAAENFQQINLARYFETTGGGLQVRERVARMCAFDCADVLSVPLPNDLDLVSCRNFLIYLQADCQQRLLRRFYQALRPGGLLFLGPAERIGPGEHSLFRTLDAQHRIYQRRAG